MKKEKLFISYNWNDGNAYADELESQLMDFFAVKRDKSQLIANDSLDDFMAEIANCENVIIVLTKKYVESLNCMLEMSYLVDQEDWELKSMLLVIDETLYDIENKLTLIRHWNERQAWLEKELKSAIEGKSILLEEKNKVDRICDNIEVFFKGLSRRKNPSQIAIVNEFVKKSNRNKELKKSSVERGEQYIKSFLEKYGEMTISELSEKSGKSTLYSHRMADGLVDKGFVEKKVVGTSVKYGLKETI